MTRRLRFVNSWAYSYSITGDYQNYGSHTNLMVGGSTALTVGKDYVITFGMHKDDNGTGDTTDDSVKLYLFISLIDGDTETVKFAKIWDWATEVTNGSPTYLDEGYIQIFSWYSEERTLTVGLTDYNAVSEKYFSQISG